MIYIDPPYNTKNDGFVYNDNFTSSTEQTLEELGYDKEYIDYIENIQGAKTHSGWLSFMYPRLLLSRDLLKDDGVIFISIDDNEVAQLRLLCDEVFGEENFMANIVWQKKYAATNDAKGFSQMHDHILVYQKTDLFNRYLLPRTKEQNKPYKNDDNDGKGLWRSDNLLVKSFSDSGVYPIVNPNTGVEYFPPKGSSWRASKSTMNVWLAENRIFWGKDGKGAPQLKRYLNEVQDGRVPTTWWTFNEVGHNDAANKEVAALFNSKTPFDTPKPSTLIVQMLKIATKNDDLILDFFAGSGTTAHAVMDLNTKDGGNRKFICVQWAEETPLKSEARKAGYETIFDITCERIKRAGEKILNQVQNDGGLLQNDSVLDTGFRTFEVVEDSKQKIYQKSLEEVSQEDLVAMMEKPDISSNEEILYNLFVAENLPLSVKYETLIENKLYFAHNVAFVLGDIDSDTLVEVLKEKKECEYITVYSPAISDDKFTLEIESNISKLGIKPDKLRFRG
jgi:adenine-specific DNA-methyltransferase